jgi:hypothetical protein
MCGESRRLGQNADVETGGPTTKPQIEPKESRAELSSKTAQSAKKGPKNPNKATKMVETLRNRNRRHQKTNSRKNQAPETESGKNR